MANGILIVDKPADWTSQDVTAKLRGVFHERRIGHGGTLDPMATGVLPVFVGRATRAVEFMDHADKQYVATLKLGLVTDTQDIWGNVLEKCSVSVSKQQLLSVLPEFTGEILQIPPMYSAIKIGGQKLYELARKGKQVERQPRPITVHELELLSGEADEWQLRVHCSKGTYVRTLLHDIGQRLGCGGCLSSLRRTGVGAFSEQCAVTMQQILEFSAQHDASELLMPVDALFSQYLPLIVTLPQAERIRHGAEVADRQFSDGTWRVYSEDGSFLALGKCENGVLRTIKSFFEVN